MVVADRVREGWAYLLDLTGREWVHEDGRWYSAHTEDDEEMLVGLIPISADVVAETAGAEAVAEAEQTARGEDVEDGSGASGASGVASSD